MLIDVPGAGENWTAWFIVSKKKVNYYTVKCRYNAVFGVQEIDRVIAVTAL